MRKYGLLSPWRAWALLTLGSVRVVHMVSFVHRWSIRLTEWMAGRLPFE